MAKLEGVKLIEVASGYVNEIEYGGEAYKIVERGDVVLGDIVQSPGVLDAEKGKFYEVSTVDSYDDPAIIDDVGSKRSALDSFDVFRKVSEPTTGERLDELETRVSALEAEETDESPKEYNKPAQVGDTILITNAYLTGGKYKNGDKLTVKKTDEDGDVTDVEGLEGAYYIDSDEFKIIGRKEASEKKSEESLVGKYVVFSDTNGVDLTAGKSYKIVNQRTSTFDESEKGFEVFNDVGGIQFVYTEGRTTRFTYEIHDEKPAEKPSIKVGDYAKVIGKTYCNDITEGTIVEVTKEADCDGDYRIELIDGSDYDFAKPEALEKIELSEADLVFIENGREPGEYKDGDIVEIIANTNYSANEVGDIGVVEYISAARTPLVNVRGRRQGRGTNHTAISDMKIIAFVESRVDIDA